jgi:MFS family permease
MLQSLTGLRRILSSQGVARALLAALGLSLVLCLWVARTPLPDPPPSPAHPPGTTDAGLYRAIVSRVRSGQDYETAAVAEHRRLGYPLRPFVVVRPPALSTFLAILPQPGFAIALYAGLTMTVVLVWWRRISALNGEVRRRRLILMAGLSSGLATALFTSPATIYFTETWSGLLIALTVGLRTEDRYMASVLTGLAAGVLRELAIPFLALMSVLALLERRRGESAAFLAATLVALGLLALHGLKVNALASPQDLASPGWVKFGGLPFVLKAVGLNIVSGAFGLWVAAVLAPLCLFGAWVFNGSTGFRLLATLGSYLLGFSIIGRPENDYWGFLIAPLIGLCAVVGPVMITRVFRTATEPHAAA